MPGLLSLILNAKARDDESKRRQAEIENIAAQTKQHELEYATKKAEVDRMKAEQNFLNDALERLTPQEPSAGGAVPPTMPGQAPPAPNQAGLRPIPGAQPDLSPTGLIDLLVNAKTMFPGSGDISQNIAPLLQARDKMATQELIKPLLQRLSGGGNGTPNGPVNMQPGAGSGQSGGVVMGMGPDELAALKMGAGIDLTDIRKQFMPKFTFKEALMDDGKMGLYAINENSGKPEKDPALVTKGPEWAFSPPQKTPTGESVIEYRRDLGLQGSINQGQFSIHQIAGPEYETKEVEVGTGTNKRKVFQYIPKSPNVPMPGSAGPAAGANPPSPNAPGGIPAGPSVGDQMIPPNEIEKWRGQDGKPVPPGTTVNQAIAMGAAPMSAAGEQQMVNQQTVEDMLGHLEGPIKSLFSGIKPGIDRFLRAPALNIGARGQSNPEAATYEAWRENTAIPIIKAFGANQRLNPASVNRAINLLPKLLPVPDTEEVATKKIQDLKKLLSGVTERNRPGTAPGTRVGGKSDPLGLRK